MAKQLLQATIKVPEIPRVRFFARQPQGAKPFTDVTDRVAKLVVEEVNAESGACALLRLDAAGALVWRTLYPSLQELKWHAEFEYGLPEEKWLPAGA